MSSVAVSPESFHAAERHPSTILENGLLEIPASLPFFLSTDFFSPICGPGGLEGRGATSSLLHGTLSWACDFLVGKQREGDEAGECPSAIARGFYDKLVGAGEVKTRLGECRAGEKTSLGTERGRVASSVWQWEHLLPQGLSGDDGCSESIAGFLMGSVVSRCAKISPAMEIKNLFNRFLLSFCYIWLLLWRNCSSTCLYLCCPRVSKGSALLAPELNQPVWCSVYPLALNGNAWGLKSDQQLGLNHILFWIKIKKEKFWLKNFFGRRRLQGCVGVLQLALGQGRAEGPLELPSSPIFHVPTKMWLQWLLPVQIAVDKLLLAPWVCFVAVCLTAVGAVCSGSSVTGASCEASPGHCSLQHLCIVTLCRAAVLILPTVPQESDKLWKINWFY